MLNNIARSAPLSNLPDLLPDLESIIGASIETRFFLGTVVEEAIAQLPGVHSVRIRTSKSVIDEIQVLATKESSPLALMVEVLTCVRVGFGLLVDDRCIRILQLH